MLSLLLSINQDALIKSLNILWQGLVAILIVVGVVILVTYLMQYISKKIVAGREKKNAPTDNANNEKD